MQSVVLDTNIIVSALLTPDGIPAKAAEAFLITGNIKHYPQDEKVITPAEFLEKIK